MMLWLFLGLLSAVTILMVLTVYLDLHPPVPVKRSKRLSGRTGNTSAVARSVQQEEQTDSALLAQKS